jgi:hypothetical protein
MSSKNQKLSGQTCLLQILQNHGSIHSWEQFRLGLFFDNPHSQLVQVFLYFSFLTYTQYLLS